MRLRSSQLRLALRVVVISTCVLVARAEKLPFKVYTTADGLAQDSINKIVRDSRGFLWFCTGDGLSRFNGYSFKTYTQEQGMPSRSVTDLLETKDGEYLIATNGGLVAFDPLGKAYRWNLIDGKLEQNGSEPPMFRTFTFPADPNIKGVNAILSLAQADNGTIYVGTNHGLYRFDQGGGGEFQPVDSEFFRGRSMAFGGLLVDAKKALWIVSSGGIFRQTGEGPIDKIAEVGGREIFQDHAGRIWIGSSGIDLGLRLFTFEGDVPKLVQTFTTKEGLHENLFSRVVAEADDGRIFVRSKGQVGEYLPNAPAGEPKFRYFDSELVETGAVDSGGNVWFGTNGKGAWKLSLNGFVSFGAEAGL
jgi:ligand-binding sensor domain-containing protein